MAAGPKDAFNSTGLRKAVTLAGVREHQAALQHIADLNGGTRVSGTAEPELSIDGTAYASPEQFATMTYSAAAPPTGRCST